MASTDFHKDLFTAFAGCASSPSDLGVQNLRKLLCCQHLK